VVDRPFVERREFLGPFCLVQCFTFPFVTLGGASPCFPEAQFCNTFSGLCVVRFASSLGTNEIPCLLFSFNWTLTFFKPGGHIYWEFLPV